MKKLFIILSLGIFTVSSNTQCVIPLAKTAAVMAAGTASVGCGAMATMHLATGAITILCTK